MSGRVGPGHLGPNLDIDAFRYGRGLCFAVPVSLAVWAVIWAMIG